VWVRWLSGCIPDRQEDQLVICLDIALDVVFAYDALDARDSILHSQSTDVIILSYFRRAVGGGAGALIGLASPLFGRVYVRFASDCVYKYVQSDFNHRLRDDLRHSYPGMRCSGHFTMLQYATLIPP
jgi:hypothetical protein